MRMMIFAPKFLDGLPLAKYIHPTPLGGGKTQAEAAVGNPRTTWKMKLQSAV